MPGSGDPLRVLVRGCGDVGSAVAHALFRHRCSVAIHDDPRPPHTRRGMSFTNALFERRVDLASVMAKLQHNREGVARMLECGMALPVTVGDVHAILSVLKPDVLVDARMRKRLMPDSLRGQARVTVGLGPNFTAGGNVDVAVETAWGTDLGKVIRRGNTRALEGEPQEIEGHARDRYIYAPAAGMFMTECEIGMQVEKGREIARIEQLILRAPLTGRLRGLTHTDVYVEQGTKVIEIDPRGDNADIYGIGNRPRRIAEGVIAALGLAA
jgi:xanthine dehydrogenase accessory factor